MALLAGPPRRDENKEEVVALVRRRLCLVPQSPYTTSVTQEPSEGTPDCRLRARTSDSVTAGSSKRRPYFHISCPSLHERPPCDENEVLPGLFSRQAGVFSEVRSL